MNNDIPSDIAAKFQAKYEWLKQRGYYVGEPIEPGIYRTLDGGWQCNYVGWCAIVIRPGETEPHEIHGAIGQRWYREWGAFDISGKRGSLGHPISDEEIYDGDGDPNDRISHFENGDIIWTAKTDETRIVNIKDRSRWYKAKHDQLLELLRRAVEAPAPERHNEALKAVADKCKEDQFDIVFLGEFQSGKSTTHGILSGGREISPQGSGTTPTSAVPVSVQSLSVGESVEWGEIKFKDKRKLAAELFSTFEREILDPESDHPLKRFAAGEEGSARDRFCDSFDLDNTDHLGIARSTLNEAWSCYHASSENKYRFSSRQRQLMEVTTLVIRFYGSREHLEMKSETRCPISEIRGCVRFPSDWQENASQGFDYALDFDDARFAFVDKVILHIQSPFLDNLMCRVTDCPGLNASAYDKEVTRDALIHADGILFFHQCSKAIGAAELGTMFEFVEDTGRTDKTVLALNLWGVPRGKALNGYRDEKGKNHTGVVPGCKQQLEKENYHFPIVWCHVLLAYLSAIAGRKLRTGESFSAIDRYRLCDKIEDEEDPPRNWSDERLWLAVVQEANSLFKVPELKTITTLDDAAVKTLWKASNFDELLGAVKETVLREKTGSILIDNGSKKALETLKSHEKELQLKEEAAEQNERQCAEEVDAAKRDLDEYEKDAEETISRSQFTKSKADAIELLSRALVDDVLSDQFYTGLARKVAKTVRKLNNTKESLSEEKFRDRFHEEVGPLITDFFADKTVGILGTWSDNPQGRWKLFLQDVYDLDDEIQRLGAARFQGKRLFDAIPIPALPNELAIEQMPEQIAGSLKGIDAVAESLREGVFRKLLSVLKKLSNGIMALFGWGQSETQILSEYAEVLRPELESSFRSEMVYRILEDGVSPIFSNIHRRILDALSVSRSAYRKKIQARCDELVELHRSSDEELRRIAEENRRLREDCIAPLRAEIEIFEKTVQTSLS